MKKFALIGNPNCGKTTLFNALTGSTAHVGNWPGVTVDKKEGVYKKCEENVSIVDLPGIYSLSPYTPEEIISRNYILDEKPDCVINLVDATNLERNLYLTTQIMEIDVPIVVALNMMDSISKNGDSIDTRRLSNMIGIPIVEISALKGNGLEQLMSVAYDTSKKERQASSVICDGNLRPLIESCQKSLVEQGVGNPLFHAIKLVESDKLEVDGHKDLSIIVDNFKSTFSDATFQTDFEALIADSRYRHISSNCSQVFVKNKSYNKDKLTMSDKIDRVLTHKILGIPIFLAILFVVFHFTFSENFLFLKVAFPPDWISLSGTVFEGVFGVGGINSPGVILFNLLNLGTGSIATAVSGALSNATPWVSGFIGDGVLGGVFAILSFLPQILLLFLFFSILEDSGYMARVAFILDRIFRKFGLSGRAFMPMIMGFGCSVPAMINTRTLADDNEKTATIRVIPFFSCGAKLPILTAIAGGIVLQFGVGNADIITYGMYLLGIVVAIVSVVFMKNTTLKSEAPPFIMELPSYHAPQFRNLVIHLFDKSKHFVKKAFTIILLSTIVIWLASHFSWSWSYLPDAEMNNSMLAGIGQLLQPIFTPLGFGSQLGSWGWVFVVAAITGLVAKENVIATFGTLAACIVAVGDVGGEGIESISTLILATGITLPALIAFIAFNMTTIPCFAAVATAKAELSSKKKFVWTIVFWILTSYLVASMIYIIGSWWWTVFIFATLFAFTIIFIALNNKGKLPKLKCLAGVKRNIYKKINKIKNVKTKNSCSANCGSCPHACSQRLKNEYDMQGQEIAKTEDSVH